MQTFSHERCRASRRAGRTPRSVGKADATQQILEARIATKAVPFGANLQEQEREQPAGICSLEPGKRLILLSEAGVEQRHVVWPANVTRGLLQLEVEPLLPEALGTERSNASLSAAVLCATSAGLAPARSQLFCCSSTASPYRVSAWIRCRRIHTRSTELFRDTRASGSRQRVPGVGG